MERRNGWSMGLGAKNGWAAMGVDWIAGKWGRRDMAAAAAAAEDVGI